MFESNKQKTISKVVFAVYLFLLCWLVLFKFSVHISELSRIRNINLVPFGQSMVVNGSLSIKEIVYNALVFVPLGVYMELFLWKKPFVFKLGAGALLSVLFEAIQFVFAIGASDITDVIANTLGCLLGIAGCRMFWGVLRDKLAVAINSIGIVIEIAALLLLFLLTIAN